MQVMSALTLIRLYHVDYKHLAMEVLNPITPEPAKRRYSRHHLKTCHTNWHANIYERMLARQARQLKAPCTPKIFAKSALLSRLALPKRLIRINYML